MTRLAAALAAVLAGVALAGQAPATPAQVDDGSDRLRVVAQTPWVVPGGTMALRVRVDDPPPGAELRATIRGRVLSRSEFARALDGRGLRARLGTQALELQGAPRDDDGAVTLRLPTGTLLGEEPVTTITQPGVHPVEVDLLDADGEVVDGFVTMLVRLAAADPARHPIGAAVVVPLHAPPAHVAPGEIDTEALTRFQVTLDTLAEHPDVPATVAPTPESVAAALDADPTAAARLTEALVGRQVLAAPWVRLDAGAWDAAGLDDELERQTDAGDAALRRVRGVRPDRRTAVVPEGGGARAVATLDAQGVTTVMVHGAELTPLDGERFPVTLARPFELGLGDDDDTDSDTVRAVMADPDLAAHAGSSGDPVLDAHHLLADLAVIAFDAPVSQRGVVVALSDEAAADRAFLDTLLGGLGRSVGVDTAPAVAPVTIADIVADVEPAGADGGADADDPLVRTFLDEPETRRLATLQEDLARARARIESSRSVFGPDDPLAARADELVLTAGAGGLDAGDRRAILGAGLDALDERLAGIHGPPRQRVTLTDREGQLQLVLGNDTGRPADVVLELRGDRLEFPDHPDERVAIRLVEPTTRIDLDVRARTSGDAPLDLRLTSPDGRLELGRSRVTVRTTVFSGVGLMLMAAAAAFLVVWWTRTILHERRTSKRRHPAHAR